MAKLLGAVFSAESINNPEIIKIGLTYTDDGLTQEQLAEIALDAASVYAFEDTVRLLWYNLLGSEPIPEHIQFYISQLTNDTLSAVDLTLLAAASRLNTGNIDLIGLYETGIAFTL